MSQWVHIVGAIHIDSFAEFSKSKLKRKIKKILAKAPKITGSETDADIYINIENGYNLFCGGYGRSRHYQTRAIITIQGDLRDRTPAETEKELNDFLHFISNNFTTRIGCITIENELDKIQIINKGETVIYKD